jgi:hypothetical protein
MNFETKLFVFWLILLVFSYVIAMLDYILSGTNVYFKYFDSWTIGLHYAIQYLGIFAIVVIVFIQLTSYFFTGKFQPFTN